MSEFIEKFRSLYSDSLGVKAFIFIALVSAVNFSIYRWSLFQDENFNIFFNNYEYVSKTEGRRASPSTFYVKQDNSEVVAMTYLALDCFQSFDLNEQFEIGHIDLNGNNVIVACSQGSSILDVSDGVNAVKRSLKTHKYIAKSALAAFLISIVGLLFFWKIKK